MEEDNNGLDSATGNNNSIPSFGDPHNSPNGCLTSNASTLSTNSMAISAAGGSENSNGSNGSTGGNPNTGSGVAMGSNTVQPMHVTDKSGTETIDENCKNQSYLRMQNNLNFSVL